MSSTRAPPAWDYVSLHLAFFVYICFVFVILHQPEIKSEIKFKEKTKEFILLILQYPTECDSDSHSVAKPDFQGEKVIKSPCIGHFLISGKIIYIDLTLFHPGGGECKRVYL